MSFSREMANEEGKEKGQHKNGIQKQAKHALSKETGAGRLFFKLLLVKGREFIKIL